jgi:hypothetical protein
MRRLCQQLLLQFDSGIPRVSFLLWGTMSEKAPWYSYTYANSWFTCNADFTKFDHYFW